MTPTEHQRHRFEHRAPPVRKGLDAWAHGLVGKVRRGPWAYRRLTALTRDIANAREAFQLLKDSQLDDQLHTLRRARRAHPQAKDAIVPGLAALAVTAERELGLKAYEVQLTAAAALVSGFFTEVDTGEGKTLAIGLAAAFNAWSGLPCHIITANDYLAERDEQNLRHFYQRAVVTSGRILGDQGDDDRYAAYHCGVTYATAKEVAADYLRDRLRTGNGELRSARLMASLAGRMDASSGVQRGLYSALIDEADHALIDEAATPLIISRTVAAAEMEMAAKSAWAMAKAFIPGTHYRSERAHKLIELLPAGVQQAVHHLDLPKSGLWGSTRRRIELVRQALEAREFFLVDEQYVVDGDQITIVDPATGRPMPMRTWQQGLHQIIEAKEGVPVTGASETLARISFQNFFRRYTCLAGASGTLAEAADELWKTYSAPFLKISRHLPSRRQYSGTRFLPDEEAQSQALLQEVKGRLAAGQPVLIGARSVDASEKIAAMVKGFGLAEGHVLNARRHREEALLVSLAGERGRLTIATSMAGRGTDIRLGEGVAACGGLHVVATEAHESARVDRQLFGRAARQGDPGSVMSLLNADDAVLKRFVPAAVLALWTKTLRLRVLGPLPQWAGLLLLKWSQKRANMLAARNRRAVMVDENENARSLGFTVGKAIVRPVSSRISQLFRSTDN